MNIKPYNVFFIICGVIYPFILFGALLISFKTHLALGLLTLVILAYWMTYAFTTTCCRCSFYGTSRCGLPGKVVPLLLKKKSLNGLPLWRIKLNYYNEMVLMVYINSVYLLIPILSPLIILMSLLVYKFVYKHKRFHGLMHLWKKEDKQSSNKFQIPIMVKDHV
jgi:predicted neutral ceramidase superfamily lipid hydrolase